MAEVEIVLHKQNKNYVYVYYNIISENSYYY